MTTRALRRRLARVAGATAVAGTGLMVLGGTASALPADPDAVDLMAEVQPWVDEAPTVEKPGAPVDQRVIDDLLPLRPEVVPVEVAPTDTAAPVEAVEVAPTDTAAPVEVVEVVEAPSVDVPPPSEVEPPLVIDPPADATVDPTELPPPMDTSLPEPPLLIDPPADATVDPTELLPPPTDPSVPEPSAVAAPVDPAPAQTGTELPPMVDAPAVGDLLPGLLGQPGFPTQPSPFPIVGDLSDDLNPAGIQPPAPQGPQGAQPAPAGEGPGGGFSPIDPQTYVETAPGQVLRLDAGFDALWEQLYGGGEDGAPDQPLGFFVAGQDLAGLVADFNATGQGLGGNEFLAFLAANGLLSGTPGSYSLDPGALARGLVVSEDTARTVGHEETHRTYESDPALRAAIDTMFRGLDPADQRALLSTLVAQGYDRALEALDPNAAQAQRDAALTEVAAFLSEGQLATVRISGTDGGATVLVATIGGTLVFIDPDSNRQISAIQLGEGSTTSTLRAFDDEILAIQEARADGGSTYHTLDGFNTYVISADGSSLTYYDADGVVAELTDFRQTLDDRGNVVGFSGTNDAGDSFQLRLGNVVGTRVYERDNSTGASRTTMYDSAGNATLIIDSDRGFINPQDGWYGTFYPDGNPFDASRSGPAFPIPGFGGGGGVGWGPDQAFAALDALAMMAR